MPGREAGARLRKPRPYGWRRPAPGFVAAAFLSGCLGKDIQDPTGGTPEPVDHKARVIVVNNGNGVGEVVVSFPAGTVTNGCADVLEPGDSCTVEVEHTREIPSATVLAQPGDLSIFGGFGGDCSRATSSQCTIQISEPSVTLSISVRFDLSTQ